MSKRNKEKKFDEIRDFANVYENYDVTKPSLTRQRIENVDRQGKWAAEHFGNNNPITLECACGRGEYSLDMARLFPERNFIGLDVKGARIWEGARIALDEGLTNVAFLRTRIEIINRFFAPNEIDEIWITFPDPFLKDSKSNRRMTSNVFLDQYKQVLKKGGIIHLKTDEVLMYDYSLEILAKRDDYQILVQERDLYGQGWEDPTLQIKTYYEKLNISRSKTIKYLKLQYVG